MVGKNPMNKIIYFSILLVSINFFSSCYVADCKKEAKSAVQENCLLVLNSNRELEQDTKNLSQQEKWNAQNINLLTCLTYYDGFIRRKKACEI